MKTSLPENIVKVFSELTADFFRRVFELLESYSWDYLVKVKLKNLEKSLESKTREPNKRKKDVDICEFE